MRKPKVITLLIVLGALFLPLFDFSTQATLKYKKETEKKCTFCHTRVPEPEDRDPQLNEEGKRFKENGYKLTRKQKDTAP
ncbi:hypothetical protein MYX78_04680 [Acidobacteria bacterium AH-259-G07]|nr:hypothetical protein [Acidobacteria bacterium AH-259-G07]